MGGRAMAFSRMTEEERERTRAEMREVQREREEKEEARRIKYEHERAKRFKLLSFLGVLIATFPLLALWIPLIIIAQTLKIGYWIFLGLAELLQEAVSKMWNWVSPP